MDNEALSNEDYPGFSSEEEPDLYIQEQRENQEEEEEEDDDDVGDATCAKNP